MHRQCFDCISVYRALVCVHCYCNASMTGEEEGVICPGRQSLSPAFITVMNQNSCKFPPSSAHQSSFASVCNKQHPLEPDNTAWCLDWTLWRIHKQLQQDQPIRTDSVGFSACHPEVFSISKVVLSQVTTQAL